MRSVFQYKKQSLLILSIIVNLTLTTLYILTSSSNWVNTLLNSDMLFMNSLYMDFFQNGFSMEGWTFPGGQYFFPDMLIYFIIRHITGNAGATYIIYVMVQQLLIMGSVILINKLMFPLSWHRVATSAILLFSFIPSIAFIDNEYLFPFYLFTVNFHVGAFLSSLLSMYLLIRIIKKPSLSLYIIFGAVHYLAATSDKIFILACTIPALISTCLLINKLPRSVIIKLIGTIGASLIASFATTRILEIYWIDIFHGNVRPPLNLDALKHSLDIYIPQITDYIKALNLRSFVVLLYPSSIILNIILITKLWNKNQLQYLFLILYITLYLLVVYWTPIVTGIYRYRPMIRYHISAYYVALLFFVPVLYILITKYKKVLHAVIPVLFIVNIVFLLFGFTANRNSISVFTNHYPKYVKNIDSLGSVYDLKLGVSTYWHSVPIRSFSRNNITAYNIHTHNLQCDQFLSNKNWYEFNPESNEPKFNFIYLNTELSDSILYSKFDTVFHYEKVNGMHFYIVPDFIFIDRTLRVLK